MSKAWLVIVSGWVGTVLVAQEPLAPRRASEAAAEAERPMSVWMEKKLEYSTAILRGLAVGDMKSIQSNASQLHLLNKVEGFVRSGNPQYRVQVHVFERVTDELVRQAERENLEGVTLAFNQMTVSCVRCHQTLRESAFNGSESTSSEKRKASDDN